MRGSDAVRGMLTSCRNLLMAALAVTLSGSLSLVALELALQGYFRLSEGYWIFNGRDNFTVPFAKLVRDERGYSLRESSIYEGATIGPDGFRNSPPLPHDRSPICVLGDSVPFGAGAGDEETFPFHLQRITNAAVVNAGVPSYTLNQSFLRWRYDVQPRFSCSLFILSAANDTSLMDYYKNQWTPKATWAEAHLNMRTVRYLALPYYVSLALSRSASESGDYLERDLPMLRDSLERNLTELTRVAPVIILPITACFYTDRPLDDPSNLASCDHYAGYKQNAENWHSLKGVNDIIRQSASIRGVSFLDTTALLNRDRSAAFVDGMHFSDKGALIIAKALADKIGEMGR